MRLKFRWSLLSAFLFLFAACASAPEQSAEPREAKIYRTGSNLPAKDYGSDNIQVRSGEILNPTNRPMQGVLSKKPGG
jgi:hypothetical protein